MIRMTWTWLLAEIISIKWYYWLAVIILFCTVYLLSIRTSPGKISLSRGFLVVYAFLIVVSTTLNRGPSAETYNLVPFWSYVALFVRGQRDVIAQVFLNIVLFIPYGFLNTIVVNSFFERKSNVFRGALTVFTATILSVVIEVTQLITHKGLCETDDVIHNTLGAIIGYGCWHLYQKTKRRYFTDTYEAK